MDEKATIHTNMEDDLSLEKIMKKNRYPFLIEYRSSSAFIFATVFITLLSNVFTLCVFIQAMPLITRNQIDHQTRPEDKIPRDFPRYILLGCHVLGVLVGSIFFGWLEVKISQRRLAALSGTLLSIISTCFLVISSRYWVLLPLQLLQGISSSCIWIMSYLLIINHCSHENIGATIGFFYCIYPLGITVAIGISVLHQDMKHQYFLIIAISLCGLSFVMQLLMLEKSKITITWSDKQTDDTVDLNYNSLHLCVEDGQWSKSSSMTTINLKDQPIVIEPERKSIEMTLFRLLTNRRLLASLYQNLAISTVYNALKAIMLYRFVYEWRITNSIEHLLYFSSHMIPYIISFIISGWLCDRIGTKKVGLISVTLTIPALIALGIPFSSWILFPAMSIIGLTISGIQVSLLMDTVLLVTEQESSDTQKSRGFARVLALWESVNALGLFFGLLLSALKIVTGHPVLCFILSFICATCIPFMYFYLGTKLSNASDVFF